MTLLRTLATYVNLVELICLVAWAVLLLPAIAYLVTTWPKRRDFLLARLTKEAIRLYYDQFFPTTLRKQRGKSVSKEDKEEHADIKDRFRHDFARLYGRRHYLLPLLLLALISGIGMTATAESIQAWLGEPVKGYPKIAISAFLGAYAWVLYDQIERFRNGDFTPHDVNAGIYRFLIAIPLAISFAALMKENVGIAVAFLLAAFPTTTLLKLIRRLVSQKLGIGETEGTGPLELEKLQCVGRTNAERYLNEGITTIAELAWTDPIDLTVRSNRDFNFVVDSISQALLWIYFEDRVKQLYPLSLRGAQEICTLFKELADKREERTKARQAAEKTVKKAASLFDMDEESFIFTLETVKDDPYAQFLFAIWR